MFEGWSDFFLMVGSAAAVLIGLIFVVISLMQGRSRSSVLAGSRIYMGPIILGVSFLLVVAAAALTPGITPAAFAIVTGAVGAWGLMRGVMSTLALRTLRTSEDPPHWTDAWYYGRLPCAVYIGLMLAAIAVWQELWWAKYWLAVMVTAGMLLAIRNEWDLITWITPRGDSAEE